jgi:hypothetical protein
VSWSFLGIASSLWIAVIVAFLFPFLMKHAGPIGDFTPIKQVVVLDRRDDLGRRKEFVTVLVGILTTLRTMYGQGCC